MRREQMNAGERELLRFMTCGSVDDGKSTLIGRLLHDASALTDDQAGALALESKAIGRTGEKLDFSLLVDGLEAEREQGITIDVAYRYFSSTRRAFIVADTPGHEQYTRNMATAASNSDLAVLLIDARKGVITQTRRHGLIVSLLGIRHIVLAVNKMDLVAFSQARFAEIEAAWQAFACDLGFTTVAAVPLVAPTGDNIANKSVKMPWYEGSTILEFLDSIEISSDGDIEKADIPLRFFVQRVIRPNSDFRGWAGIVASGVICPGDEIVVSRTGQIARVARIVTMDGDLAVAVAGDSIVLTLDREIDVSRGDVIAEAKCRPALTRDIVADLIWLSTDTLKAGQGFMAKIGTKSVPATVTAISHTVNIETGDKETAGIIDTNAVAGVGLTFAEPITFDPYDENRTTGSFILIDRNTNATVAAGMVRSAQRGADNVYWHNHTVQPDARAALKGQKAVVVWLTGLPASGKSTIANRIEAQLHASHYHAFVLDGDNLRHGLNQDLGFTPEDRGENVRRVAEVAGILADAGMIVFVALVSPSREARTNARIIVGPERFLEVHIDAPVEVCATRDPKGLYARAKAGSVADFTGVSAGYEQPRNPDLVIDTSKDDINTAVGQVIALLKAKDVLSTDKPVVFNVASSAVQPPVTSVGTHTTSMVSLSPTR